MISRLQIFVSEFKDTFTYGGPGVYSDLLLGEGGTNQIFSLIQAQNVQVKCLVIFKSGKSLMVVVFFFFLI
jgi:hypothetical protein